MFKDPLLTMILCGAKVDFVLSESPFWPKIPLSCFSFGAEGAMVSNGSLRRSAKKWPLFREFWT